MYEIEKYLAVSCVRLYIDLINCCMHDINAILTLIFKIKYYTPKIST